MSSSKAKFKSVEELEALLRAGDMAAVKKSIQTLNRNQVSRADLLRFANIANRVDLPRVGYRFLHPVVRALKPASTATELEKIEYSESLRGMGLINEAKKILEEVDPVSQPKALLRISFCLMTQWKYAEAIGYLQKFLQLIDPKDYLSTIAQVNLAAALVVERYDEEAHSLLEKLRKQTSQAGHQLLYGNCLELSTQLYVLQGRYDLADETLREADAGFVSARTRYSLYLRKWKAISKSMQAKAVHLELYQCRDIAAQDGDWETSRECDLFIGFLTNDHNLLEQVYFGTPSTSYRKRISTLSGDRYSAVTHYVWNQCRAVEPTEIFDISEGRFCNGSSGLEQGQLLHRLLILLASDFYRPLSVGNAFSELFPDENYSQMGSTNRISQLIKRLRQWLSENGDLLSIEETDGHYRLRAKSGVGIRITSLSLHISPQIVTLRRLKEKVHGEEFSRNKVIEVLNCSAASANRFLRWTLETGQCEALGAGPRRRYRLTG